MNIVGQAAGLRRPDAYTSLLLRGDGNGQTIRDLTGKTISVYGGATLSTTKRRFIGNALYFDGTGDYIDTPSNVAAFQFGTGAFTIEAEIYCTAANSFDIIGCYNTYDGVKVFSISVGSGGAVNAYAWNSGGTTIATCNGTTDIRNAWHHVAFVRSGTSFKLFIDGTQEGSTATSSDALANGDANTPIRLGAERGSSSWYYYTGYIDEPRISKGIARYTSNFTRPTRRY